jgi:hypothetical protein
LEVSNRYRQHIEGDETVALINRKSVIQLQEYFDETEGKLASSLRVEIENNPHSELEQMNLVLRDTRRNVTPLATVEEATPIVYPQTGYAPIGCPTTLNPSILVGALENRGPQERNPAPWLVRPQPATTGTVNRVANPFEGYKKRTWCITCGMRKMDHVKEDHFGPKCVKDWCGKCYQRAEFHLLNHRNKHMMGPLCYFPDHPQNGNQKFWYT